MGKVYAFVLGIAAGCGLYHLALHNHLVRASDGFHLTPKMALSLEDTYIDIRNFTAADALEHPQLGAAIAASGNAKLQQEFTGNVAADAVQQVLDSINVE
ncbi:MAG: hypothetical protein AAF589_06085 [Planctomycetota bacterium]